MVDAQQSSPASSTHSAYGQSALVIIDMQAEMQARLDDGRDRVNGDAATQVVTLAQRFRDRGLPVIHVRHADNDPGSPFHPDSPGYQPMPCDAAMAGEAIFVKQTSSAFASTALDSHLRRHEITHIVVVGAVAGFCVSSTVGAASDLGYSVTVVEDAVLGFALSGLSAAEVFNVSLQLLAADFARVTTVDTVLAELPHEPAR